MLIIHALTAIEFQSIIPLCNLVDTLFRSICRPLAVESLFLDFEGPFRHSEVYTAAVTTETSTLLQHTGSVSRRHKNRTSLFQLSGLELSNRSNCSESTIPQLAQSTVNGVEKFVFFVGYARSGHSMIGSVIDAHPNMIIAHEYFLMEECSRKLKKNEHIFHDKLKLFSSLYSNSYLTSKCGWRSDTHTAKGYNFNLDSEWQGAFTQLRVIGDKSGDSAVQVLSGKHGSRCLEEMSSLNMSVTAIHVVRNPYDMIATTVLYTTNGGVFNKTSIGNETKVGERLIFHKARDIFSRAKAIEKLKVSFVKGMRLSVVEIHIEDFIQSPRAVVSELCECFKVECPPEYVEECARKTYRGISRTRDLIKWPRHTLSYVKQQMQRFSFFRGYTYGGNFRHVVLL